MVTETMIGTISLSGSHYVSVHLRRLKAFDFQAKLENAVDLMWPKSDLAGTD